MRKRKKLIKSVISLLCFVLLILIGLKVFRIKTISCESKFTTCPINIANQFNEIKDRSMFLPLPEKQINEKMKSIPQVKTFTLQRVWPSTIKIAITERMPIGAVQGQSATVFGLIDEEGHVINTVQQTSMSILSVPEWQPGMSQLAPIHITAINALRTISDLEKTRVNGQITEQGLVVNSNGVAIIIDPKMPVLDWYSSLQVIVDRSKIQNKIPRKIDLRFNQPVLEY